MKLYLPKTKAIIVASLFFLSIPIAEGTDSSITLTIPTHPNQIFVLDTGYIDVPASYSLNQYFYTNKKCPAPFYPYVTITTTQQREYASGSRFLAAFGACVVNTYDVVTETFYLVKFLQQRVSGVISTASKIAYQYDFPNPSYPMYGANSDWIYNNPPYDPSRGLTSTAGTIRRIGYDGTSTTPTNEYYQGGFRWELYCYPSPPPPYSIYCKQGVTPYT